MKIIVCKGCGQVMQAIDNRTGKPACVTCIGLSKDSGIPVEVDMPEELTCNYHCGSKAILNQETGKYIVTVSKKGGWNCCGGGETRELSMDAIPFIDTQHKTFYCGCWGWD